MQSKIHLTMLDEEHTFGFIALSLSSVSLCGVRPGRRRRTTQTPHIHTTAQTETGNRTGQINVFFGGPGVNLGKLAARVRAHANLLSRSTAAASVSSFLQKAKRRYFDPSALSS